MGGSQTDGVWVEAGQMSVAQSAIGLRLAAFGRGFGGSSAWPRGFIGHMALS